MVKFTVVFKKDNSFRKYYTTILEAEDENDARRKAIKEAEDKGVVLPDEVWGYVKQHKVRNDKN